MPVYMFSFHAYRTWNADNKRGFVQRGEGIQPPNDALARAYDNAAKQPPVRFDVEHQRILIWIAFDACARRNWHLHCVGTEPTHVHIIVSWRTRESWQDVSAKLKNLASLMLGRKLGQPGRRWFVREGSRKRVRDKEHLHHLVTQYLPSHRGLFWRDGDAPPIEPEDAVDTTEKWRTTGRRPGRKSQRQEPSAAADG